MEKTAPAGAALGQLFSLYEGMQVVDLSATLENDIPRWPTHPPLVIHHTISHEHDGYFTNTIFMPEHVGTHCDAPAHIHPDRPEQTVDTLSPDALVGPADVFDLTGLDLKAGETAGAEVVLEWERKNGSVRSGDIALFNFGWFARHWRKDSEWMFYAKNSPGLTKDAVSLLYDRGIKALGSDLIACDQAIKDGVTQPSYAHEVYMLPHGHPLIEELANLDRLPARCFFIALPLKIRGGSGSPLRAVALVPKS
ncbi:MAG: cyclase family protein [Chloroflexi bacterium]|nr:cyclase family protein [Chloroflexota bacterium]